MSMDEQEEISKMSDEELFVIWRDFIMVKQKHKPAFKLLNKEMIKRKLINQTR